MFHDWRCTLVEDGHMVGESPEPIESTHPLQNWSDTWWSFVIPSHVMEALQNRVLNIGYCQWATVIHLYTGNKVRYTKLLSEQLLQVLKPLLWVDIYRSICRHMCNKLQWGSALWDTREKSTDSLLSWKLRSAANVTHWVWVGYGHI